MASARFPNPDDAASFCLFFLQNYLDPMDESNQPKYMQSLQTIADRESRTLNIELDDVEEFCKAQEATQPYAASFVSDVESNSLRFIKLFAEAADRALPSPDPEKTLELDVFDVLSDHRRRMDNQARGQAEQDNGVAANADRIPGVVHGGCPDTLLRRFDTYIIPRSKTPLLPMRKVTAENIGKLVRVRGVVTHITDVKPLVTVVAYTDPENGCEVYQEVTGRTFKPLDFDSANNNRINRKQLPAMETRGSKFVKFQEARIQEMSDEVPEGATPRTLSVHLRGEITRSMKPGEEVTLAGIFLPEPYTGFRGMRAGLLVTTYLEVQQVVQERRQYGSSFELTPAEVAQIEDLGEQGDVYGRLARSIAPEIYGMEDVKKALLLLMVSGQTRTFPDGLKLRGDIHMCLMGDPGVAKSQLLKYVSRATPRAVYTTGKGSSGVGLTAAVLRNQVTKELVLEGGALVLADKGICCIDEFDKMEEGDRTAIHEVMEQQTVSIAKAGITTTLNTRTTILSAANPAYGRYDKRRSPSDNINLPAALLSRFDLLWLLLDEPTQALDERLARHVLTVHLTGKAPAPAQDASLIPQRLLRAYVGYAKQFNPDIPEDLTDYIATIYAELRQLEKAALGATATYTTPRTLLSILRLSQALAKLRFDNTVVQSDVDEALRLMRMSKASLESSGGEGDRADVERTEDAVSLVYRAMKEHSARTGEMEIPYSKILELTKRFNVSRDDILECVDEYERISLWSVGQDQDGNPIVTLLQESAQ